MTITVLLSLCIMLGIFLMICAAVMLIRERRFFTSAPKDIQAAIQDRPPPFPGAKQLGYAVMGLSILLILGAVFYAGFQANACGMPFRGLFLRYLIMFYLYLLFDIVVLDWFLLTRSHFYQHFYPETIGCAGYHAFGFNRKEKLLTAIAIPVLSLILTGLWTVLR